MPEELGKGTRNTVSHGCQAGEFYTEEPGKPVKAKGILQRKLLAITPFLHQAQHFLLSESMSTWEKACDQAVWLIATPNAFFAKC